MKNVRKRKPKVPLNVRVDPSDLTQLKELGIDAASLVRDAIKEVLQTKVCPCCGK